MTILCEFDEEHPEQSFLPGLDKLVNFMPLKTTKFQFMKGTAFRPSVITERQLRL